MNIQQHRGIIIYVGAMAVTFGVTGVVRFLAGAFGLAGSTEFRMVLGFGACLLWIYASRAIEMMISPRCPVCGQRPCQYPRCTTCGKHRETHHAQAAGEDACAGHAQP